MSLKSRFLRSVALPAVLAFGAVSAPALAAEGQPIAPKTCYTSDANGPANEKLSAAMRARDQKIIITANRAFPMKDAKGNPLFRTGYNEEIFTSNLDGSEGYSIASDVPSGQVGTKYCIGPMRTQT